MTGGTTTIRTQVAVNDAVFSLAHGQDDGALRAAIEAAVAQGGRFVSFMVVGSREVSVLFTPHTSVAFSTETVAYDERDDGDPDVPFGGFFDE